MSQYLIEKIGYFHGRFQPFHRGHLTVVKYALERHRLVAIGISNPFRTPPVLPDCFSDLATESLLIARSEESNPWPYWARLLMIHEGLHSEGLSLERILFLPNLSSTGLEIDETRFPKHLTTVYICPKGEHNRAIRDRYLKHGWELVEVPPNVNETGSGSIREKMIRGENWEAHVPSGTASVIKALGLDAFLHEGSVE